MDEESASSSLSSSFGVIANDDDDDDDELLSSTDQRNSNNNINSNSTSAGAGFSHEIMYKNRGMTSDALRKRREEATVEIRKQKRDQDLSKRRHIDLAPSDLVEQLQRECLCDAADERIVGKLCGMRTEDVEEALDVYRRRFRGDNANEVADEIVALNLVPRIVHLSQFGPTLNIRRTATHIIGAIVSVCSKHTEAVVKTGVLAHLVDLIESPDHELRELTLFALGNIVGENSRYRDFCLQHGMAEKMTKIPEENMTLMEARCAVWAASNLCRGREQPVKLDKIKVLLPMFNEALYTSDVLIVSDACRAFARLLDAVPESYYKHILKPNTVERLVEYLGHPVSKIALPALLAVGNIVSGDDEQTQGVLNCPNALSSLHRLLLDGNQKTKCDVCWVLSNIAAGTPAQVQMIFDGGFIPTLVQILKTENFQVRTEACWVISNAIMAGQREHIAAVVREGVLPPLSDMLTVMDSTVVVVVLKSLQDILECGECCKVNGRNPYTLMLEELEVVKKLEFLSMSPNSEIYTKAGYMVDRYFVHEDEECDGTAIGGIANAELDTDAKMDQYDF